MTRTTHTLFIGTMSAIVVVVTVYLSYVGWSYYQLPLEERFYHPQHNWFKPSGAYGHGIGILGTFLILFGVVIYIARKRYNFMTKQLRLKYLLEFHIFLCTLGPILILFHTAFKFGGLVSVAFWSMVAVVASGVIGRFIYIQIPRTVEGRELSLNEVKGMRAKLVENLKQSVGLDEQLIPLIVGTTDGEGAAAKRRSFISRYLDERKAVGVIRSSLKAKNMAREEQASIIRMVKEEFALSHRIGRLLTMQKLFKYWHVAHLPFALIMLIVLIIHVAVTLSFGYKWIFLMEVLIEQIAIYGSVLLLCGLTIFFYMRSLKKKSAIVEKKVAKAKEEGMFEPVSLHPYIDLNTCIGSAACVADCPEKDILGIVDGKATVILASNCVGHGACFHACPVQAISLRIGTETRGIDLPHVDQTFETNIKGIYIAGELGGMGLIRNGVEQGKQAMANIASAKKPRAEGVLDVVIIGAGPAGISATLEAKKQGLTSATLEQDSLGGTVYTFPRSKLVMTSPMDLPLHGKVKLYDTTKDELLQLWRKVISEHKIEITENTKVDAIVPQKDGTFKLSTNVGKDYICNNVLLAIGRRGTPRKLGIPGEESTKVAYRLLEPENIAGKKVVVVGGGDAGVESAMLLMNDNEVLLVNRNENFAGIKPKNREAVTAAIDAGKMKAVYKANLVSIAPESVLCKVGEDTQQLPNDLVYIFAGGELPTGFLQKAGIEITKRFGHIVKKHT